MRGHRQHAALVESWFELLPAQQEPGARAVHAVVMRAAPGLEVTVRGGSLVYAVRGVHAMALAPFRTHLHLQVFRGAGLAERFPELDGTRGMRQWRVRHGQQIDELLVDALTRAAVSDIASAPPMRRAPSA